MKKESRFPSPDRPGSWLSSKTIFRENLPGTAPGLSCRNEAQIAAPVCQDLMQTQNGKFTVLSSKFSNMKFCGER
jgi:hypothetical protein